MRDGSTDSLFAARPRFLMWETSEAGESGCRGHRGDQIRVYVYSLHDVVCVRRF